MCHTPSVQEILYIIKNYLDDVLVTKPLDKLTTLHLQESLKKINPETLSEQTIRASQGSAGVADLYKAIKEQVLP